VVPGVLFGKPVVEPPGPLRRGEIAQGQLPPAGHATRAIRASSGLLAPNLPLFPRRLQLPVALRMDVQLPPRQHILRRDVARGAVQLDVVVVVYVSAYQTPCIIER